MKKMLDIYKKNNWPFMLNLHPYFDVVNGHSPAKKGKKCQFVSSFALGEEQSLEKLEAKASFIEAGSDKKKKEARKFKQPDFASAAEQKVAVVRAAMNKLGSYDDVEILISETGWQSDASEKGEDPKTTLKHPDNAKSYFENYLRQWLDRDNLLYRAKTVFFQLQDEPDKDSNEHWGIYQSLAIGESPEDNIKLKFPNVWTALETRAGKLADEQAAKWKKWRYEKTGSTANKSAMEMAGGKGSFDVSEWQRPSDLETERRRQPQALVPTKISQKHRSL